VIAVINLIWKRYVLRIRSTDQMHSTRGSEEIMFTENPAAYFQVACYFLFGISLKPFLKDKGVAWSSRL
jgi:hypothetical protein